MQLFDCTLRDGANDVGLGFTAEMTTMIIRGLLAANIKIIEFGSAHGIGSADPGHASPLTDEAYLDLAAEFYRQAELGMFLGAARATPQIVDMAAKKGLGFLRVGANAGSGETSKEVVKLVKSNGLRAYYSLMKGYILSARELAAEGALLEKAGADAITIMDSAGTMFPEQVFEYVTQMKKNTTVPVGFHAHNNLGLSAANALAAAEAGCDLLDCSLMGAGRSAGNLATEQAVAVFWRKGLLKDNDLYALLTFIDEELAPAMQKYGFKAAVSPIDLIFGFSGCHSSFKKLFEDVAQDKGVDLYRLIIGVSAKDKKAPSTDLIRAIADEMKKG